MNQQEKSPLDRKPDTKRMLEEIHKNWPGMNKPPTKLEKLFLWFLILGLLAGLVAMLISRFTGAF